MRHWANCALFTGETAVGLALTAVSLQLGNLSTRASKEKLFRAACLYGDPVRTMMEFLDTSLENGRNVQTSGVAVAIVVVVEKMIYRFPEFAQMDGLQPWANVAHTSYQGNRRTTPTNTDFRPHSQQNRNRTPFRKPSRSERGSQTLAGIHAHSTLYAKNILHYIIGKKYL